MRIIAGQAKGRRLQSLGGRQGTEQHIRPTTDRARESLFNILGAERAQGAHVLDLFAGTGALGIEALSRGAASAVFVDISPVAVNLIKKNISLCGFSEKAQVSKRDLTNGLFFLQKVRCLSDCQGNLANPPEKVKQVRHYDMVFLDPPYRMQLTEKLVAELVNRSLLNHECMVVCEDRSSTTMPDAVSGLALCDQRKYGDTGFWFYK